MMNDVINYDKIRKLHRLLKDKKVASQVIAVNEKRLALTKSI